MVRPPTLVRHMFPWLSHAGAVRLRTSNSSRPYVTFFPLTVFTNEIQPVSPLFPAFAPLLRYRHYPKQRASEADLLLDKIT